ncbi:hypothetical protein FSP39_009906 [Pinctada imbricata]|uniref:Transmembrane protein 26 n=1 Tax=Pinctada imbricata TaxID=66713 RepID=A0AA89BP68_PINIB|nr:hypothetical protein FSP39_009906 [Pinctada imbricata]
MVLVIDILKASVVRIFLLIHSFLAVWRAYSLNEDSQMWWLAIADVALFFEGLFTITCRKGLEYKWFCPCFFFYLCGTIPSIWLLELDRRDRYVEVDNTLNSTLTGPQLTQIYGVSIPVDLPPDTWVVVIEQLLLYFMIIGRWLLPRGKISRNELSQLLFVFIGMASDITELFTLFDEQEVRESEKLTYAILIIWTISLLQFCFVLTATKSTKKTRVVLSNLDADDAHSGNRCSACVTSEIWSILVAMCMQDVPFLVVRMYSIVKFKLITYSIIFFTAKNVLVTMLLLYRLVVICEHKGQDDDELEENVEVVIDDAKQQSQREIPAITKSYNGVSKRKVHPPKKGHLYRYASKLGSL